MNQERKVSVLRSLLERVQQRAAAPRTASASTASASMASAGESSAAPAAAAFAISAPSAQPSKTAARPGSSTLPLNFGSSSDAASFHSSADVSPDRSADQPRSASAGAISDPGSASEPEGEADQGPPSAPRLREVPEQDAAEQERDIDEEEPPLKTPPPESGRQHVTPSPAVTVGESDDDISITVTMEESELPPSVSRAADEVVPMPMSASHRADIAEVSGAQPRLALVSEPEIELHGMTPLSALSESIDLAVAVPSAAPAVPSAAPSGVRPVPPPAAAPAPPPPPTPPSPFARTAPSVPDTKPSVSAAPESAAAQPAVRLMAQPLSDPSGKPLPPVEVWASTFTPAPLRGHVTSFVGQNANFEPKTFGELVRASIALAEEKS